MTTQSVTLRSLRTQSKLSLGKIVKKMAEYDGKPPRSRDAIIKFENRGTRNIEVLRAFAHAYEVSLEVVERAAASSYVDNRANITLPVR